VLAKDKRTVRSVRLALLLSASSNASFACASAKSLFFLSQININ